MEQTFGSFVREKRQSIGLSLRTLAAKLDLSPVYLSNIENDRRPAPTRAYLERLEQELHLSKVETEQMLDLAAKSQNNRVFILTAAVIYLIPPLYFLLGFRLRPVGQAILVITHKMPSFLLRRRRKACIHRLFTDVRRHSCKKSSE